MLSFHYFDKERNITINMLFSLGLNLCSKTGNTLVLKREYKEMTTIILLSFLYFIDF